MKGVYIFAGFLVAFTAAAFAWVLLVRFAQWVFKGRNKSE